MNIFIIADNQELTSLALTSLLKRSENDLVLYAKNKAELLDLLKKYEHTVVFLDYTLFDFPSEDSLLVTSERYTMTTWILISEELTEKFLRRILYASHAFGVVFKDMPVRDISEAIQHAKNGKRYICQRAIEAIMAQHQDEEEGTVELTSTEIDIVKAIALGKTTKEIASERFLSIHTVNTHRKNIFRKLGVNSAYEVIRYAIRSGWVDPI